MNADDKMKIMSARYQFVLRDPYPQISEWDVCYSGVTRLRKFLNSVPFRPSISPYKAWQDGFAFA